MIRNLSMLLLSALAFSACAEKQDPKPDPEQVRRLLANLETHPAAATVAALPAPARDKVGRADRMMGSLEKVQPEKIDPAVAAALIAR